MPVIARRQCCSWSRWMVWLMALWLLFAFVFPLFLFRLIFHYHSPYFYFAYLSILLLVTYAAFTQNVEAELPRAPATERSAATQTVDVDMPVFDYKRFKEEEADGSADQCVICLVDYEEAQRPALSLPTCRHNFHVECVGRWLRSHGRCPICSASPFPTHAAPTPPDVVRVSVAIDAANTRNTGI